ncbi:MAG TPA: TVP38/TMEM64 family protein [Candidatus Limnocylindrales bacterium]|nr:TVP38/TMEM64 family protein [Candidatus Limnocylindrales bacterium]
MEGVVQPSSSRKGAAIKASIFIVFIVGAIYLVRFTPVKEFFTPEVLGRSLESAGIWAPLIYIVIYTVGVCLFVPGTVLTALGAAIFGPYWGFLYVWLGAMAGSSVAFFIGRTLGRDFAASLIGDRLKKYDDAIARNGFATVLYLRLIYFPFTPLNFGMGLTRVRFLDYFFGTALGILVGTFIFTFFVGTLKEVLASGDWSQLLSVKVLFSLVLFVFSFFIPKLVKKFKEN